MVAADYIKQIWVPDTFFVNEKTAYFHVATQENQFLRITHLGAILRSMRLTVKATCPMDLSYFPMDSQLCTLEIESYGYTMSDLVYNWHDGLNSVQVKQRKIKMKICRLDFPELRLIMTTLGWEDSINNRV